MTGRSVGGGTFITFPLDLPMTFNTIGGSTSRATTPGRRMFQKQYAGEQYAMCTTLGAWCVQASELYTCKAAVGRGPPTIVTLLQL